jgi:hypothetical protein
MRNLYLSVIIVAILAPSIAHSANQPRVVSVDEAKNLVLEALPPKTRHLPKFGLDQYKDKYFPQFYFFSATWAGAPNGSSVIGNYAVDSSTGDVWSATECEEESTPELRKLQAKVRLRLGLSDSEYHKIKRKGPVCP